MECRRGCNGFEGWLPAAFDLLARVKACNSTTFLAFTDWQSITPALGEPSCPSNLGGPQAHHAGGTACGFARLVCAFLLPVFTAFSRARATPWIVRSHSSGLIGTNESI